MIGVSISFLYASDSGAVYVSATVTSSSTEQVSNIGSSEERTIPVTERSASSEILLRL